MTENARIQVRIGAHEFSAEGPPDLVRAQYDQFLEMIAAQQQTGSAGDAMCSLPIELVKRAYLISLGGALRSPSINVAVPGQPAESRSNHVILLLYGALALDDCRDVPASDLIANLKRRGLAADEERIDRLLDSYSGFVVKSGAKRGSRYGLTKSGVKYAEKLIAEGLAKKMEAKKE